MGKFEVNIHDRHGRYASYKTEAESREAAKREAYGVFCPHGVGLERLKRIYTVNIVEVLLNGSRRG